MEHKKYEYDLQRIQKALRRGAIERNVKTGLIVAAAASGALISSPALIVTAGITMGALYLANSKHRLEAQKDNDEESDLHDSSSKIKQK